MILPIEKGQANPILRQKAQEVKEITAKIRQLILNMNETLEANNGLGLAASQVGQSLRIILAKPEPDKKALVLINPEIKKTSRKKEIMIEGCLSLPDEAVAVERAKKIAVAGSDINGKKVKIKAEGLFARVLQHEIDHLEGILITDKRNNSMSS
jgi:peptide deformylase